MKTTIRNILLIIIFSIEIASLQAQSFHFSKVPSIGIPQFPCIYTDFTDSFWTVANSVKDGYTYFKSVNGIDWYPSDKSFQRPYGNSPNLIKTQDNYLFNYNTYGFSLSRSIDSGATWVDISNKFPDTPGTQYSKIFTGDTDVLYLYSSKDYAPSGLIQSVIYKSMDHGNSWIKVDQSKKQFQTIQQYLNFGDWMIYSDGFNLFSGKSIDSATYLFNGNGLIKVGNTIFCGTAYGNKGLIYSNDTGRTWTSLSSKMFNVTNASILFNKGDTFFVSTNLGNLFSYDKGQTWTNATTQYECDTNQSLNSIVANSHTIIAINNETGYMIFDPTYNLFVETKLPQFAPMSLYIYGDLNEKLSALVSNRIYTFSSNEWQPIFCSTTNDLPQPMNYQYIPNFFKKYGKIFANGDYPSESVDNGKSWYHIQQPTLDVSSLYNVVGLDSFIYVTSQASSNNNIYLSDRYGNILQSNPIPPVFNSTNGNVSVFNFDKKILLFQQDIQNNLDLIISNDFGKTWRTCNSFPYDIIPQRLITTTNYLFYNSFWGDGLKFSKDGGESWEKSSAGSFPSYLNLYHAIELPDKIGFLFQTDSIIYFINDLNKGNVITVFNSHSNGIVDMQVINNHLYIQTGDNTIWFSTDFACIDSIITIANKSLLTIYPVPSQDVINIVFDTSENPVSYAIYNLSGEQIMKDELNGATQINIQNLNEGIYFLQIIFSDNTSRYGKFIKD